MDIQQIPFSNTAQEIPAYDRLGAPTLRDPDGEVGPYSAPAVNASFGEDRIVRNGDGSNAAFAGGAVLYDEDDGSFAVIVPRNDWSAGTAPESDPAASDGLMGVRIVA